MGFYVLSPLWSMANSSDWNIRVKVHKWSTKIIYELLAQTSSMPHYECLVVRLKCVLCNEAITKIIYELLALTISMPNVLIVSLKCNSADIFRWFSWRWMTWLLLGLWRRDSTIFFRVSLRPTKSILFVYVHTHIFMFVYAHGSLLTFFI